MVSCEKPSSQATEENKVFRWSGWMKWRWYGCRSGHKVQPPGYSRESSTILDVLTLPIPFHLDIHHFWEMASLKFVRSVITKTLTTYSIIHLLLTHLAIYRCGSPSELPRVWSLGMEFIPTCLYLLDSREELTSHFNRTEVCWIM